MLLQNWSDKSCALPCQQDTSDFQWRGKVEPMGSLIALYDISVGQGQCWKVCWPWCHASHIPPLFRGLWGLPRQMIQLNILVTEGGEDRLSWDSPGCCDGHSSWSSGWGRISALECWRGCDPWAVPKPCWSNFCVDCPCTTWDRRRVPLAFPRMDELSAAITPILS